MVDGEGVDIITLLSGDHWESVKWKECSIGMEFIKIFIISIQVNFDCTIEIAIELSFWIILLMNPNNKMRVQ